MSHLSLAAHLTLWTLVWTLACTPRATPGGTAAAPDGNMAMAQVESQSAVPQRTLDFDGERYVLQRAYQRGNETVNDYLLPNETASNWTQVLLVSETPGATDLKAFTKGYTDSLKSNLAVQTDSYDLGTDSKIVSSFSVAPDRSYFQYGVFRAVIIANQGMRTYTFLKKVANTANTAELSKKREVWLNQIGMLDVPALAPSAQP
jgi:hypothetical protein